MERFPFNLTKKKKGLDANTRFAASQPRAKTEFTLQVEALKRSIREKHSWKKKITDPVILERYFDEAVAQGATKEAMQTAIDEMILFEVDEYNFDFNEVVSNGRVIHDDGVVPEDLKNSLETQLDAIASSPFKDFHPGSGDKVQDLIHPSLYPYIKGTSIKQKAEGGFEVEPYEEKETIQPYQRRLLRWECRTVVETSKYQWLPAIYTVKNGKTEITSYINNLDRKKYPKLYEEIAKVFDCILPSLQILLQNREYIGEPLDEDSDSDKPRYPHQDKTKSHEVVNEDGDEEVFEESEEEIYEQNPDPKKHDPHDNDDLSKVDQLKNSDEKGNKNEETMSVDDGPEKRKNTTTEETKEEVKQYQVITKACNYVLKPGQTYEGVWHVEGTPHERIIASVIYYYQNSECLEDSGLAFRAETPYDEYNGPSGLRSWRKAKNLGTIRTPQGRVITFTNDLQHRVTLLKNVSKTEIGTRKILCFFVVDPDEPIVSSAQVPIQQWNQLKPGYALILLWLCKQLKVKTFPEDVVKLILSFAKVGLSWEEAKEHREKLMKERKYFINQQNQVMERDYSLCEH